MKVRNGWVGNSSSSSFIIFGITIDTNTNNPLLDKYLEESNITFDKFKDEDMEWDFLEYLREKIEDREYSVINESEYPGADIYIGSDPNCMKDDETKKEYKERVINHICNVFKININSLEKNNVYFYCGEESC